MAESGESKLIVAEHVKDYDFLDQDTDMHNQADNAENNSRNMPMNNRIESRLTGSISNDV